MSIRHDAVLPFSDIFFFPFAIPTAVFDCHSISISRWQFSRFFLSASKIDPSLWFFITSLGPIFKSQITVPIYPSTYVLIPDSSHPPSGQHPAPFNLPALSTFTLSTHPKWVRRSYERYVNASHLTIPPVIPYPPPPQKSLAPLVYRVEYTHTLFLWIVWTFEWLRLLIWSWQCYLMRYSFFFLYVVWWKVCFCITLLRGVDVNQRSLVSAQRLVRELVKWTYLLA